MNLTLLMVTFYVFIDNERTRLLSTIVTGNINIRYNNSLTIVTKLNFVISTVEFLLDHRN